MGEKKCWRDNAWEVVKFVVITLLVVIPIRTYVAQPFIVSGLSMYPSFNDGEYLIIDELTYLLRQPKREEVVVFRFPKDPSKFFIKRVIGLPGETVVIKNNQITIRQGNTELAIMEADTKDQILLDGSFALGPEEYFVLGDNRNMSLDSRAWGAVPEKLIKGRVLLRLFPFNRLALLPASIIE